MPDKTEPTGGAADADVLQRAADQLYAAAPDAFMALRAELATQARTSGAAQAAKQIGALRKPTLAASVVNRLALDDPSAVDRLIELGGRMRQAHDALDAGLLRDLSGERRTLVGELCAAALDLVGARTPSTALKDEVVATLDAAVADPDVAQRLGRLQRSEHWSGFGFATASSPELTLVRGGKDTSPQTSAQTSRPSAPAAERPTVPPATRRRIARALEKAQTAFHTADTSLAAAEASEQSEGERVRTLTTELAELQQELDDAKRGLEQVRREVKSARTRRREARSALDRAERQAGD